MICREETVRGPQERDLVQVEVLEWVRAPEGVEAAEEAGVAAWAGAPEEARAPGVETGPERAPMVIVFVLTARRR